MGDLWDILKAIIALVSKPETRIEAILALVGTAIIFAFSFYRLGRFLQLLRQNKLESELNARISNLQRDKADLDRELRNQRSQFQKTVDPLRERIAELEVDGSKLQHEIETQRTLHRSELSQAKQRSLTLEEENASLTEQGKTTRSQLRTLRSDLRRHEKLEEALLSDDGQLWTLRPPQPPPEFHARLLRSKPKIVTLSNLKGGVGKTMLTATLAAFFDQYYDKRVLALDLDYQGTLTDMMFGAADAHPNGSQIDGFILGTKGPDDFLGLRNHFPSVLPKTHIIGAEYELSKSENRALISWLLDDTQSDLRYRLATLLLDPVVQENYDIVLIDTPPRLGPALLNALCASHAYFVPTILDRASAEAVTKFVGYVDALMPGLNQDLEFCGVIANSTDEFDLTDTEKDAKALIETSEVMNGRTNIVIADTIRYTKKLHSAAGNRILYTRDKLFREGMADKIGREVAQRIALDTVDENRSVA